MFAPRVVFAVLLTGLPIAWLVGCGTSKQASNPDSSISDLFDAAGAGGASSSGGSMGSGGVTGTGGAIAVGGAAGMRGSGGAGMGVGGTTMSEVFDVADRPTLQKHPTEDYALLKPWNYDKPWNAERLYPLVIALHGGGGDSWAPFFEDNDEQMKAYPSFLMAPHTTAGSWGAAAAWLIAQIESIKSTYRIDTSRLYLVGFSMGGSGSYAVANAYADSHGQTFAGIIRMAGQSETTLRDAIVRKTSVWYHIGLEDNPARIDIAREAYDFIKKHADNAGAVESSSSDTMDGYSRTTLTLTKNGIAIFKKSEYAGLGHDGGPALADPGLLAWLFAQSTANR